MNWKTHLFSFVVTVAAVAVGVALAPRVAAALPSKAA